MKRIRVAACALNQTPLDWAGNKKNIIDAITMAKDRGVGLLCLPEMSTTGYGCEDFFHSIDVQKRAYEIVADITYIHTKDISVSFSLPTEYSGALYNTACLSTGGNILGYVPKQNMACDGVYYESRWFKPWPRGEITGNYGDLIFSINDIVIGYEICEDAWVANRPGADLARRGVDIILNPSASHFAFGRHKVRKQFVLEGSRAFNATYVYSNLLGNEAGRIIYGGDTFIASGGKMLAEGQRLSFKDVILTTAVIDVDDTRVQQTQNGSFRPKFDNIYIEQDNSNLPHNPTPTKEDNACCIAGDKETKYDEFSKAVSLGLFDYMRKSRSNGFILSLSGGADSAACAALVRLMCEHGINELGMEKFNKKSLFNLSISGHTRSTYMAALMDTALTCVYQSTKNSSETTLKAAKALAEKIGSKFIHWDVDAIAENYIGMVEHALGRTLTWENDDLALQNIQPRVRSPGIWMLANISNALLISTSNRSEASVGYTTMDGDSSGGLAPIAGADKNFLLDWLKHMSQSSQQWFDALNLVVKQKPTAELRPSDRNQTDEGDLMPYDVLDFIERTAIHKKKSPQETLRLVNEHYGIKDVHRDWVKKFFTLWARNQWKRERYAVSFHLDDVNVDPKTWCRFPILSGGFKDYL